MLKLGNLPNFSEFSQELRETLYRGLHHYTTIIAICLFFLFLIFAVLYAFLSPAAIAPAQVFASAVSALALLILSIWLSQQKTAAAQASIEKVIFFIATIIFLNSVLHISLTGDPVYTINLMILVVGTGLFFLSPFWVFTVLVTTVLGWLMAFVLIAPETIWRWAHYGGALFLTTGLSLFAYYSRTYTICELNTLILENEAKNRELAEALAKAEENHLRYKRLSEATFEGIILHENGTILDVNSSAAHLLGYTLDELIGTNGVNLATPEYRPLIRKAILEGKEKPYEVEALKKDGSTLPVELCGKNVEIGGRRYRVVAIRDISERKKIEAEIRKSLHEKELLLKEIHHRVKNNLQIIDSLLHLQAKTYQDERIESFLRESQVRIKSIALVHEILYKSNNFSGISFDKYARTLCEYLFRVHGVSPEKVRLHLQLDSIFLDIDQAMSCGLILNELVTNALKYAFPGERKGRITVKFIRRDEGFELIVEDDGVGIDQPLTQKDSLGLELVQTLASQMDGVMSIENKEGTLVRIHFASGCIPSQT